MMRALISFELKKSFRSKKNRVIIAAYAFILVVFALSNMVAFKEDRKQQEQEYLTHYYDWVSTYYTWERLYEISLEEGDDFSYFFDESFIYYSSILSEYYLEFYEILPANDREKEFDILLAISNTFREFTSGFYNHYGDRFANHIGPDGNLHSDASIFSFTEMRDYSQAQWEFLVYCRDNDIPLVYENEMTGFNFMYQAMNKLLPFVVMFIILASLSDIFSSENRYGSYKFLLFQPFSRVKVYFAKLIASVMASIIMIFAPLIVVFLAVGFINGFGSPQYPVLYQSDSYISFEALPNSWNHEVQPGWFELENNPTRVRYIGITPYSSWKNYQSAFVPHPSLEYWGMLTFMLSCLPLYLALFIFAAAVSAFFSVLTQRDVVSIALCVVISLGGVLTSVPLDNISWLERLNPFLYLNPVPILNGIGSTTALTGMLLLLAISALIIVISLLIFKKQDIRC